MNPKLKKLLLAERDGCHGESERRLIATFLLDTIEGDPDGPGPWELLDSLEDAITDLRRRLDRL